MVESDKDTHPELDEVRDKKWGEIPEDNFGYASDEERRNKRGLEDWEMVEKVPQSQKGVPKWFIAVIVAVVLVAIGLSFPFWGDRPGYEREWINWGFGAALLYLLVFGGFVYLMVNKYSSSVDGTDDMDLPDRNVKTRETAQQTSKQTSKQTENNANQNETNAGN
ncbi:MAG: hypothetical protein PVG89_11915 [Gammaproteobacteria bacterium]|jgi:hypothetical protein